MKTTAAALLLALSGCSGASSDSPSLNIADRDFITDSVAHLRVDLAAVQDAAGSLDPSQAQVVREFARLTEAELDALSDMADRDDVMVPDLAEALKHVEDVEQHSAPQTVGPTVPDQLAESSEGALARARSHLERGRHEELRGIAERMVVEREKLRSALGAGQAADE
ncbi:hypothetical protein [Aeromicrobium sp. CTD01-1L150]|uniref:hypothetical protein n=1 Tax=Aeromicrobium sp. CTD01-1L150 TaxID=3341830 RepID=UPI0035C10DBD